MARKPYTPDVIKTGNYLAAIWRSIQDSATLKDYERKELLRHINRIWSILTGLHLDTLALLLGVALFGGCNTYHKLTHPGEQRETQSTPPSDFANPPAAPIISSALEAVPYYGYVGSPVTYAALPGAGQDGSYLVVFIRFHSGDWIQLNEVRADTQIGDPCFAYDKTGHFGPAVRFMDFAKLNPNPADFFDGRVRYWIYLVRAQSVSKELY